jgi:hypothetical protein
MSQGSAKRWAWTIWVLAAACTGLALTLNWLARTAPAAATDRLTEVALALIFLVFATVGCVLVARQPHHPVGWLFVAAGGAAVVDSAALAYARYGLPDLAGSLVAAWLSQWVWVPAVGILSTFLLLLFPDGHLVSPRWRVVAWLCGAAVAANAVARAIAPGGLANFPQTANPLGLGDPGGTLGSLVHQNAGDFVVLLLTLASVASLVVRYRHAGVTERLQLKWFLSAAALLGAGVVAVGVTNGGPLGWAIWIVGVTALPLAAGVAILRYHLYDIDRLISKTLVYGLLTVVLGGLYGAFVLVGEAVFSSFAGQSSLAVTVSTLLVAALFLPARGRVQRLVDRRFYRRRYDAQLTLQAFGARLRQQVELEVLAHELHTAVTQTVQPAHQMLWLRDRSR